MKCLLAKVRKNEMSVRWNKGFSENMELVYLVIPDILPYNMLYLMIVGKNLHTVMNDLLIHSRILR